MAGTGRAQQGRGPSRDEVPPPRLAYVVGRLERALRRRIDEAVQPLGLTTPQYTTLSVLALRGGLSNAQLARRAFVRPQSMSELVAVLERDGLVEREAHPTHRRILRTQLTREGRLLLGRCDRAVDAIEAEMLRELGDGERRSLLDALEACVRGLGDPDARP
ncbi:MAG: MarR family winged helix-turn-helix transcriptional regulator [Gaiellaceae bacterium]